MKKIYASPHNDCWAIVDDEDYEYFRRWKWCKFRSRSGAIYLRRAHEKRRYEPRRVVTLYLHREILRRAVPMPRRKYKQVASHIDGNSLNCTRANLEWVRKKKNTVIWGGVAAYSHSVNVTEHEVPF